MCKIVLILMCAVFFPASIFYRSEECLSAELDLALSSEDLANLTSAVEAIEGECGSDNDCLESYMPEYMDMHEDSQYLYQYISELNQWMQINCE